MFSPFIKVSDELRINLLNVTYVGRADTLAPTTPGVAIWFADGDCKVLTGELAVRFLTLLDGHCEDAPPVPTAKSETPTDGPQTDRDFGALMP